MMVTQVQIAYIKKTYLFTLLMWGVRHINDRVTVRSSKRMFKTQTGFQQSCPFALEPRLSFEV